MADLIDGVEVKILKRHYDDRGFFEEIIRVDDDFFKEGFGQWSHSVMYTDVIKSWHIHSRQCDWWAVPIGVILTVLYDKRIDSKTRGSINEFIMGNEPFVLKIPPGVAHGCKVLQGPAHLMYITSELYDVENPDEGRIPHDSANIGYDWLQHSVIK